jgi:hypothetical protein
VCFNERIAKDMYGSFSGNSFQCKHKKKDYGWFQNDSATAHTARMFMQALSSVFGDRIISSGVWPACSPSLNPCDFFFWSCLKDKAYNCNPQTEEELEENLYREIVNICVEQLYRVNQNFFPWCEECLYVG